MGLSSGWKEGMSPTKWGRGSMGVSDLGLWVTGFGRSMSGGGMRCLEMRKSKDYSVYLMECYSGYGDYYLLLSS